MTNDQEKISAVVFERKPTEAEIALDLKSRFDAAMNVCLAIMDEANGHGLLIGFDGVQRLPPFFKNSLLNLRVEKRY